MFWFFWILKRQRTSVLFFLECQSECSKEALFLKSCFGGKRWQLDVSRVRTFAWVCSHYEWGAAVFGQVWAVAKIGSRSLRKSFHLGKLRFVGISEYFKYSREQERSSKWSDLKRGQMKQYGSKSRPAKANPIAPARIASACEIFWAALQYLFAPSM